MTEPIVYENATLLDAIYAIEKTTKRIAVVLNNDKILLGTLTDGDIRRYILSDGKLTDLAIQAMNPNPVTSLAEESKLQILDKMRFNNVIAIPILDHESRFSKLVHLQDMLEDNREIVEDAKFECAVILAGGKGTRLLPYTEDLPKPMLEIGGVPIIERQVNSLKAAGVKEIYISVNYLKDIIIDYFEDGKKFDVNITYLFEDDALGTAGPLSNLKISPKTAVLVLNGDIYTTIDYTNLWNFYVESVSDIVVAAVEHQVTIPFGLLKTSNHSVSEICEKPTISYLCNAGIYVLKSEVIESIPKDKFSNMTDMINNSILLGKKVAAFPVYESWVDIGNVDQLQKAREYFIKREIVD